MRIEAVQTPGLPFGELFREPRHIRADLRLLRRAVRERWAIPADRRDALVAAMDRAWGVIQTLPEGTKIRATLRACWVIIEMSQENHRLLRKAIRLAEKGLPYEHVLTGDAPRGAMESTRA